MAARKPASGKRYYTPAQANATLPLVRRIVADITEVAGRLRERQRALARSGGQLDEVHREELETEFEQGRQRLAECERELAQLGIELKDYFSGLIDFPCWMDGREVYLCWRQGEAEVGHWHELDAGFAGRRKLLLEAGPR